jgi:hypothetical protein
MGIFRNKYFVTIAVLMMVAGASFAQSASIDIDTDTFITAINQWLPMAITIAAIGVGIAGGFKLAQFVGRMIVNAFDGRL